MERPMAETARKLNHGDYLLFPDDGLRHELVDGEHFVSPPPRLRHQRVIGRLYMLLGLWAREGDRGEVLLSPMSVIFSSFDVVEPDLIFLAPGSGAAAEADDWVRGVPELLVEVLSPSSRRHDAVRKRALYERFGVAEYWLVDPQAESLEVYRLEGGKYTGATSLSRAAGHRLTSPLLPGFGASLEELFVERGPRSGR
jgi:Uma2 family endonuclease